MRKPKLANITGVVALSYLVLLPAGFYIVWRKTEILDKDVTAMWDKLDMPATEANPIINIEKIKRWFRG